MIRTQLLTTSGLVPVPVIAPKPRTLETVWERTVGARDWSTCTPEQIYNDIQALYDDLALHGIPGEPTGGLL